MAKLFVSGFEEMPEEVDIRGGERGKYFEMYNNSHVGDKMKLFEYVVLHREKARKDANGNEVAEKLTVVLDVARLVAKDERAATMTVARLIPEAYVDKLDDVEIALRPF